MIILLSTDTKPTSLSAGAECYESDTKCRYIFNGAEWIHLSSDIEGTSLVVVTPAIAAASFSANVFVGGKLTLVNAVRSANDAGVIDSLLLLDAAKQNSNLKIYIFKEDLAGTYNDNAAELVSLADWQKCLGCIEITSTDYTTLTNASMVALSGMSIPVKATSSSSLYALIVTTSTPTYSLNCLQLTFGIKRN